MTTPTTTEPAPDVALTFQIVPATAESLAFVLSAWGRAFEFRQLGTLRPGFLKDFGPVQARIIRQSKVLTAMTADNRIAGFVVFEPGNALVITSVDKDRGITELQDNGIKGTGILHWITTRSPYRKQGVARALLDAAHLKSPLISSWTSDLRRLGLAQAPHVPFWLRS